MATHDTSTTTQIARAGTRALAVRSSALVARGLRDLARDSNWLIKKVFTGRSQHLAISPAGQVCAISEHVHHGSSQVALYDIELSVPTMTLAPPAGEVLEPARTRGPFFRGRRTRVIWLGLRARGLPGCICSTCRENFTWEKSAERTSRPRIWPGPIRVTTLWQLHVESGQRCEFGNHAGDLREAKQPENSRRPIGSSPSRPVRNSRRKVHLADTEGPHSVRTKKRSRA